MLSRCCRDAIYIQDENQHGYYVCKKCSMPTDPVITDQKPQKDVENTKKD